MKSKNEIGKKLFKELKEYENRKKLIPRPFAYATGKKGKELEALMEYDKKKIGPNPLIAVPLLYATVISGLIWRLLNYSNN